MSEYDKSPLDLRNVIGMVIEKRAICTNWQQSWGYYLNYLHEISANPANHHMTVKVKALSDARRSSLSDVTEGTRILHPPRRSFSLFHHRATIAHLVDKN